MDKFMNGLYSLAIKVQPLVVYVVIAVLIVIGVMLTLGEESRTKAKKWAPWVMIGCGVALGAVTIGKEIAAAFVF